MTKVEQFEHIRKAYFLEKKTIRFIARTYKVHRRIVRQAIASAIPPERKTPTCPGIVLTLPIKEAIDGWLKTDREAPKKQRHTAHRIYQRLLDEFNYQGAEPTIKKYVGKQRRILGMSQSVFIPQLHLPGEEAEVDWYEAWVEFPWGKEMVQIFQMRACFSGREFHRAYSKQTQQAFLEAHTQAFMHFGGVFHRIRYDNLTSAVKKVLQGRKRQETERFILLRSYYLFESVFCRPGKEGAHEKGGVEGGVGRFRRNHLVPIPKFNNYDELNTYLLQACLKDDKRTRKGHSRTIQTDWNDEELKLLSLPKQSFECHEIRMPTVNHKGLVMVDTNQYSVPVNYVNCKVEVRLLAQTISCWHQGRLIAQHERLYGRYQISAQLDHYLELLRKKPGALKGALPLAQAREKGQWPATYDNLWKIFIHKLGQTSGTQAMLDVLFLHRHYSIQEVHTAVEWTLAMGGGYQIAMIELLIRQHQGQPVVLDPLHQNTYLKSYDRTISSTLCYDTLLQHH